MKQRAVFKVNVPRMSKVLGTSPRSWEVHVLYPYHAYTSSTRHSQGTVRSRINLLHAQREGNIRRINHSHAFLSPINIDIPKLPCISAPPLVAHAVDSIDELSVTNRTATGRFRHQSNRVYPTRLHTLHWPRGGTARSPPIPPSRIPATQMPYEPCRDAEK